MSKTHWKKLTNPNYLGDYSLPPGGDLVVVIDYVADEEVVGTGGKSERKAVAHLRNAKPMVLNKTNMKTMTKIFGTPYIEDWCGRSMQIFYDPTVKFGKSSVGGLRIRPFLPEQSSQSLRCADCGQAIRPANGKDAAWVSAYTYRTYGKELCAGCAALLKEKIAKQKAPDPLG